jgi:hypothetical protein
MSTPFNTYQNAEQFTQETNLIFKPNGAICLFNTGGIEVMTDERGDGLYYRFSYGQDNIQNDKIFEAEIEYLENEDIEDQENKFEAAFIHAECTYFLSTCMRIYN